MIKLVPGDFRNAPKPEIIIPQEENIVKLIFPKDPIDIPKYEETPDPGEEYHKPSFIQNDITKIKYGFVYNYKTIEGVEENSISSHHTWDIPTLSDISSLVRTLMKYGHNPIYNLTEPLIAMALTSRKIRSKTNNYGWANSEYPLTPGSILTAKINNSSKFNLLPAGKIENNEYGNYSGTANLWIRTDYSKTHGYCANINSFNTSINKPIVSKLNGCSIRLIKKTTKLTHGYNSVYTGNDGKIYRTICIGEWEWLADNLAETKLRNDTDIKNCIDPKQDWNNSEPLYYIPKNDPNLAFYI